MESNVAKTQWSTREAARLLGVPIPTLATAVWSGRIPEPPRFGNAFSWGQADILKAAEVLGKPAPVFGNTTATS